MRNATNTTKSYAVAVAAAATIDVKQLPGAFAFKLSDFVLTGSVECPMCYEILSAGMLNGHLCLYH